MKTDGWFVCSSLKGIKFLPGGPQGSGPFSANPSKFIIVRKPKTVKQISYLESWHIEDHFL